MNVKTNVVMTSEEPIRYLINRRLKIKTKKD